MWSSATGGLRVMRLDRRARVAFRHVAQNARSLPLGPARLPRLAWFNIKRALRIPTRSDRQFLVEEFGRQLAHGRIGTAVHVTIAGRYDGAGSQALARMSAICIARKYGLTYVHTPFLLMQHNEGPPDHWATTWERMLNLGHGEESVAECRLPRMEIDEFMAGRRWWSSPCLLSIGHMSRIADRMPDAYLDVIPQLRNKYYLDAPPRARSDVVEVCAHLRRGGDVSAENPDTAYRYVANDPTARAICATQSVLKEIGLTSRVRLFSQGDETDFASLRDLGFELCLNTPAIPTFRAFVEADILIMTKSSFSYAAAILNGGVKLYDRFARAPMSEWIVRESDGSFDRDQLRARCEEARA
jgi:hypothetical protein